AAVAPMPSAVTRIALAARAGLRRSIRAANLRFWPRCIPLDTTSREGKGPAVAHALSVPCRVSLHTSGGLVVALRNTGGLRLRRDETRRGTLRAYATPDCQAHDAETCHEQEQRGGFGRRRGSESEAQPLEIRIVEAQRVRPERRIGVVA